MKNFIKQLHIWLSIPLGVVISVTCFSGAMLVFEKEITPLIQREYYYVAENNGEPLPLEALQISVEATLAEGEEVKRVETFDNNARSYIFHLNQKRTKVCVDQYSGQVLGRPERPAFFTTMFRLHRWLMDAPASKGEMSIGKLVVGISTIAMVIVLISGIIVWWPKSIAMLKNRLKVSLTNGWRRFWYDMHVSVGFYASLLLLVMALTGLVWSFGWYRDLFYGVFGDGAREWLRALHIGTIGGMTTRILWFIAALIGAMLPLTGYYLWIKRKLAKRSHKGHK